MSAPPMGKPSHNNEPQEGDGDLAQSLKRLAIATSPSLANAPRSPRAAGPKPLKPVADMSPASPRPGSAMRSPLRSSSASIVPSSRSATPTLLRKASMNSLHSANGPPPSRRPSTAGILSPSRPRSGRSPLRSLSPELQEPPAPTPHSVASSFFNAELQVLHGPEPTRRAETVVILQDACYGHRYSRPRASRAQLSTIVERPERIKACVLGVSAAYVRLGERHQDGAFPVDPATDAGSLPSIPFRIQRSSRRLSLGSQTVTNVHGTKWMEELKIMCDTAEAKLAGGGKEVQRPNMDRGLNAETPQKLHEGDLYLCSESLEAIEGALGGVCDAVDAAFRPQGPQRAFVAIRPPGHHCSATHPSGFCWINNVHVGIMHAVLSHGLTHAAIIDFDLHHGDGSQSIAWQHNARGVGLAKNAAWWKKTSIGYFSLHDINSYPCEMGDEEKVRNASICIDNAHGQSIWNVHLQPWKTEADFWALYESKYGVLLGKTRAFLKSHTDRLRASGLNSRAAIFLSAGFDASEYEDPGMQRHKVNVPTEFYARFTRDVVRIAAEEGTSVEGRIISVLEGGYSDRALCSGVFSHLCGLAGDGPSNRDQEFSSSASDMGQKPVQQRARKDSCASERGARRYESSWWSATELEQLEATLVTPEPAPRPVRNSTPPTYSSPTQASQARVVNLKTRRSVSGLSSTSSIGAPRVFYEPPPPPDVPWTVAALELSKLLIPTERQTASCTADELNAAATKIRSERQAALAGSVPPNAVPAQEDRPLTRMGLRERRPKPPPVEDDVDRKSRRKTVAGPGVLATEGASGGPGKQSRSSRRLSVASTVVSSESLDTAPPVPPMVSLGDNAKADVASTVESTAGVAAPSGSALNVKKTRAPAKKEAIHRAPKTAKKPATTTTGEPSQKAATLPTAAASSDKTGDDMDKLAGEMKKIKITVLTKAQKEARERERLAREKLSTDSKAQAASGPSPPSENKPPIHPSHPSKTPTPGPSTATATATNAQHLPSPTPSPAPAPAPHSVQTPTNPSTPSLEETPTPAFPAAFISPPTTDPRRVPLPASSPPPPPPASSSSPSGSRSGSDLLSSPASYMPAAQQKNIFVPYQPDGPPPPPPPPPHVSVEGDQLSPQKPLQWLPPNVCATPVQGALASPVVVKRAGLPVFTSTGVIPFAPSPSPSPVKGEFRSGAGMGMGTGEGEVGGGGGGGGGFEKRDV
ncbi:Arginase/deacetylase [Parathielavia hyrcaniae]|uniref:Arginase/deacetylase n=1 Tax=Parathielavia hyrcaniae TaxID=113614 RepID=A0AAN6PYM7_9PEZI|nr:Arginase/deacetylase [Parathielavia hyrcaniae]